MSIDSGSTIIAAIIIIITATPFVMMSRGKAKREKKLYQKLIDLANQKSAKINKHEALQHLGIGLDTNNHIAFFYDNQDGKTIEKSVDLKEIKNVNLVKDKTQIQKKSTEKINRVGIEFLSKNKNQNNVFFEFFNDEKNPQVFGEIQMAEKWVGILQTEVI